MLELQRARIIYIATLANANIATFDYFPRCKVEYPVSEAGKVATFCTS